MASGMFFNPLVALRVAPVVSSACSILFARDQRLFFSVLKKSDERDQSGLLLPSYYQAFFKEGLRVAMVCTATTTCSCVCNLYVMRRRLFYGGCDFWYMIGAALAVGRMLQVSLPRVASHDVNNGRDEWFLENWLGGVAVDWAAWMAVSIAVCKALDP